MPITINESTTFFIAADTGDVPEGATYGLFVDDTRFLSEYALRLDGLEPVVLAANIVEHHSAEHFLTNPELDGAPVSTLEILRRRRVGRGMRDELLLRNYGDHELHCSLDLVIDADFAHIFDVKRTTRVDKAEIRRLGSFDSWIEDDGRTIRLCYQRDRFHRELVVRFSESIATAPDRCHLPLRLAPGGSRQLTLEFTPVTTEHTAETPTDRNPELTSVPKAAPPVAAIVSGAPTLETDSYILRRAYDRSVRDFAALRLRGEQICEGNLVVAAGIPWYMALFGRDSLIASYQALAFAPEIAAGTLRALASLQGDGVDPTRAEEPGKILHEHRFGTLAGTQREISRFPYYGTVDATPLFLILLAATFRATGDLDLVSELYPNALRALDWIEKYGDLDRDGYLEYPVTSNGLANQGWKDSGDSVRFQDGRIAEGPIALCEVQGYAYAARLSMASLAEAVGEPERAARLRHDAEALKQRFNHDFWLPESSFYAEALDGGKRPVDSLTSNPGHLLWSGIVAPERAASVARTLLSPELFSGWGVRTMATTEGGYNPVSYHNGSVWPHDNSLIVAGLARHGFTDEATRITDGIFAALSHSADHRLPELFAGFGADQAHAPVQYPTACRPQAWASGTIFLLLTAMAGIIDAPGATISNEPFLPTPIDEIRLRGLWQGGRRITLRLRRADGQVQRTVEP